MQDERPKTGYKSLEIYQLAHALGVEIHHFTLTLPRYEMNESGSQLRRASKSISANIVEGYGRRRYKSDFLRFLIYAQLLAMKQKNGWNTYAIVTPHIAMRVPNCLAK